MCALKLNELTGEIVDACFNIHKTMGLGLYEKVYADCLNYELSKRKIRFTREHSVTVHYEDLIISQAFKVDFFVEETVVVELKSVEKIIPLHEAQIINYMRLCKVKTGLLINFNVPLIKEGIKRFML
jgi:GxxExxY protein